MHVDLIGTNFSSQRQGVKIRLLFRQSNPSWSVQAASTQAANFPVLFYEFIPHLLINVVSSTHPHVVPCG